MRDDKEVADETDLPFCMLRSASIVTIQSFLFGFTFTCLNACLVSGDNNSPSDCFNKVDSSCPKGSIYNDLDLSSLGAQLATSLTIVGAWIGALIGSYPAEVYGRRPTLLGNNLFFICGAVLAATGNVYALYLGRFISGIGVGVGSAIPPVLLSEMSLPATRGFVTTLHQVMLTFSIFFASILGYALVTYVDHGWQYIQAFEVLPAALMLLLGSYLPESPKWMVAQLAKGSEGAGEGSGCGEEGARAVKAALKLVRSDRDFDEQTDAEVRALWRDAVNDATNNEQEPTWREVFSKMNRRAVLVGCGLMFFQASTGINSVFFYSSTIFGLAGFSQSIIGTAIAGGVNFLTTLVSTAIIDSTGRKVLLTGGTYGMLVFLIILSSVLLSSSVSPGAQGIVAVVAVVSFVISYACGLGAVCWAIMSEIVPTRLRSKAMALFMSINWATNLIVAFLTLTAIDGLGQVNSDMTDDQTAAARKTGVAYLYIVFAAFTVMAIAFFHFYVPETRGKKPEDFQQLSGNQDPAYEKLIADDAVDSVIMR